MITLEELATNSPDKLVQGFVNETITDSYLLGAMTFDDCLASTGTSDLIYGYKRVKTPMSAAFRALNAEPEVSEPKIERIVTKVAILSNAWKLDRVAKEAAPDLYQLHLEESKNAIIRKFNATLIAGDTAKDDKGFDGLAKAVKGTSTEMTSAVDLSMIDQKAALAFAEEMDTLLSLLMRTPDVLLVSPHDEDEDQRDLPRAGDQQRHGGHRRPPRDHVGRHPHRGASRRRAHHERRVRGVPRHGRFPRRDPQGWKLYRHPPAELGRPRRGQDRRCGVRLRLRPQGDESRRRAAPAWRAPASK